NSIMERRPPSVTAASFKYGQKYRKCSGRNVMNANGFKKFEHDSPYGPFGFRQNMPVWIQNDGCGLPYGTRLRVLNNGIKQVWVIMNKSDDGSGIITKPGVPNVNGNA
ncbi:hypothetical protein ACVGW4_10525, partial [Enterobacter hormaechei]